MDYLRLAKMQPRGIYKKYLWRTDKTEWLKLLALRVLQKAKVRGCLLLVGVLVFLPVQVSNKTEEHYILKQNVEEINQMFPVLEKAYVEIEELAGGISKVAYKDPDLSFLYAFFIVKWAREFGLDPMEVAAVAMTESSFLRKAISSSDARGIMQIHAPTWKMPGSSYFDAERNIEKGARILAMYKRSDPATYLYKYSGGKSGYASLVGKNERRLIAAAKGKLNT